MAVRQADGSFSLHGYKWFTSATDANMAFTLARVQDAQGLVTPVWNQQSFHMYPRSLLTPLLSGITLSSAAVAAIFLSLVCVYIHVG